MSDLQRCLVHLFAPRTLSPGGDSFVTIAHAGLADGVLAHKADVTESEESGRDPQRRSRGTPTRRVLRSSWSRVSTRPELQLGVRRPGPERFYLCV